MGANYPGQETAIKEISNLSDEAKKFLNHHICNALNGVTGGIQIGDYVMAEQAAWHILEDLELAGIRQTKAELRAIVEEAKLNQEVNQ